MPSKTMVDLAFSSAEGSYWRPVELVTPGKPLRSAIHHDRAGTAYIVYVRASDGATVAYPRPNNA